MTEADSGRPGGRAAVCLPKPRSGWPLHLSPVRLLFLIAFLIFAAEAVIMFFLNFVPALPPLLKALLDAGTLLLFLSPLYFIVFRPLREHYLAHLHADREIRTLSRETLRALERERTRFVQDIHEDCGQMVTALGFGIDILRYTVPPERDDLTGQCRQLQEFVAQLGDKLRNLSARLRPALLETCGIVAALDWHVRQLREQGGTTKIVLDAAGCEGRFDPELETAAFRLCQEGLANVLRHSGARTVTVRLACDPQGVWLEIADDGRGFDRTASSPGLGLVTMRERVAAFDGTFEIDTAPGQGTALRVFLPLPEPTP